MFQDMPLISPGLVRVVVSIYSWFALMWRGAYAAFGPVFQWIQRHEQSVAAVPWEGVRQAFRRMRAFLPFIYADLGRKIAPFCLAQDAAGPSPLGVQGPTGSFSLAVGFPNLEDLSKIFHSVQLRSRNSSSYSSVLKTALELATSRFPSGLNLPPRILDGPSLLGSPKEAALGLNG